MMKNSFKVFDIKKSLVFFFLVTSFSLRSIFFYRMVDKQIVKHLKIRFDECRRKYQDGAQTRCYQTYEDWQNTREDFLVKCK